MKMRSASGLLAATACNSQPEKKNKENRDARSFESALKIRSSILRELGNLFEKLNKNLRTHSLEGSILSALQPSLAHHEVCGRVCFGSDGCGCLHASGTPSSAEVSFFCENSFRFAAWAA